MDIEYLTETIKLPVSGIQAVIEQSNGNKEKAIFARGKSQIRALMDFWALCTRRLGDIENPSAEDLMKLVEPDYIRLGLHIYCLATGRTTLKLAGPCARCGKPNGAVIDLKPWMEAEVPDYAGGPDPTWQIVLPQTRWEITYGYPIAAKEIDVSEKGELDLTENDLLAIRTVNGSDRVKYREVAALPTPDAIALREAIKEKKEWYETRVGLRHSCGFWEEVNFMLDPRFVAPGLIV